MNKQLREAAEEAANWLDATDYHVLKPVVAKLRAALAAPAAPEWRKVEDGDTEKILICAEANRVSPYREVFIAYRADGKWWIPGGFELWGGWRILGWQPLPEPMKGEL